VFFSLGNEVLHGFAVRDFRENARPIVGPEVDGGGIEKAAFAMPKLL
jgi:hypothetical protein